ncbi:MAG: imidazole glycerol phosphate synthase subunit HisH [Bdellovibrionales bacterium]|nr:imidazole glycerol phosphate synthase subunit HisH [Bdellovibrionales bacterium]
MSTSLIGVVDYGLGNIQSVCNALERLGCRFSASGDDKVLSKASAYILPGVGAFGEGIDNLNRSGLRTMLNEHVIEKRKPILGICLGMQLFADASEEMGDYEGLGWIPGRIKMLPSSDGVQVPHVGWNNLSLRIGDPIFSRIGDGAHVFFDHSYSFVCDQEYVSAVCSHGIEIVAGVQRDNIFGVQFHPEKSQNDGLRILRGFFNYAEGCVC